jgi:hypothetical protein
MKKGVVSNNCTGLNTCPASLDGYSDLKLIDGKGKRYWGINDVGGCMPVFNGYMGSYLCDPDNTNPRCPEPLEEGSQKSNVMPSFNYQMDAISANSGLPLAAYTSYITYQVEWVMGREGYVRWMIEDLPIYEIPAEALENPPQDDTDSNPKKLMIEEPLYIIFNVALSTSWGSKPPNPGQPCRGDGKDPKTNKICDDFPMYLKIDYIRIYQDTSPNSTMAIGCDPSSHPTKEWIEGHLDEYQDAKNLVVEVIGGAPCKIDDDCTVEGVSGAQITTGTCKNGKCVCLASAAWGGPRCTLAKSSTAGNVQGYGPSIGVSLGFGIAALVLIAGVMVTSMRRRNKKLIGLGLGTKKAMATGEQYDLQDLNTKEKQQQLV